MLFVIWSISTTPIRPSSVPIKDSSMSPRFASFFSLFSLEPKSFNFAFSFFKSILWSPNGTPQCVLQAVKPNAPEKSPSLFSLLYSSFPSLLSPFSFSVSSMVFLTWDKNVWGILMVSVCCVFDGSRDVLRDRMCRSVHSLDPSTFSSSLLLDFLNLLSYSVFISILFYLEYLLFSFHFGIISLCFSISLTSHPWSFFGTLISWCADFWGLYLAVTAWYQRTY